VCSSDLSQSNGLSVEKLLRDLDRRGFTLHRAQNLPEAKKILHDRPVGAALVDLDFTGTTLFKVYEVLQSCQPPMPTLLLGSPSYQGQSLQPRALGRYDEYVRVDDTCTLEYLALHLRGLLLRVYPTWEGSPVETPPTAEVEAPPDVPLGELVCIFSAKGGTGKTTIATNLAVGLSQLRSRQTALIDGDLYFGDVDIVLNVQPARDNPRRSLSDVASILAIPDGDWDRAPRKAVQQVDADLVDQLLFRHPTGVRVLLAPPRPEMAEQIPRSLLKRAVEVCRQTYEYTVIDMPSSYSEGEIGLMDAATRIIMVLKPEMSSLRNTALFVEYAESFGWRDRLIFVLNRADSNRFTKISREDVERHLGCVTVPILSSGTIPQAVSEGSVVLTRYPGNKVAAGFEQVLNLIDGESGSPEKTKKPFLGLFGRNRAITAPS
jgi:MinD-like ATPase involved in chromosome partitioning or flagellar assembly